MSRRNKKKKYHQHQNNNFNVATSNPSQQKVHGKKFITSMRDLEEIIKLRADVYDDHDNKIAFIRVVHGTILGFYNWTTAKTHYYYPVKQIVATESSEKEIDRTYSHELNSF